MKVFNTTINTYSDCSSTLNVGDYILFQTFDKVNYGKGNVTISKPIYAIYLGGFINEDLIGFNFVRWINPKHKIKFNGMVVGKEATRIDYHIEYVNYVHIIKSWKNRPNFNELLTEFRKGFNHGTI